MPDLKAMSQIINFYQDAFKKPRIIFPFGQMVYVLLSTIAVCFLYMAFLVVYTNNLKIKLQESISSNETITLKVSEIEKTLEVPKIDSSLEFELNEIRENNADKKHIINFISTMSFDKQFAVSAYYDALEQNDQDGIWLTEVEITDNSKNISLTGVGKNASEIPDYIDNLKKYSAFKTKSYFSMTMLKQENEPHYVDFYFTSIKKKDGKGI
ncbi:MAG TPA: PilN domain-containing protein [Pseudomonadales bacterium]|nr:PilN domain-containing protein [Pseudomonadales bacterium]